MLRRQFRLEPEVSAVSRGKGLDPLTVCIDNIQSTRNSTHHHANNNKGKEDIRNQIAISLHIVGCDAKPIKPDAAKEQLEKDQDDAKLGLVGALVKFDHAPVNPVSQQPRQDQTDY